MKNKAKRGTRRTATPRIVRPSRGASHVVFILLVLVAFAAAMVWAFSAGRQVGDEGDALATQVSDLKQRNDVLTRSQERERETNRDLSRQLQEAQSERVALEQEASFLRRAIQGSGKGIVQPQDFKVEATSEPGEFRYGFTVRQLIQDFGKSAGRVEIRIVGQHDGKVKTLSLAKLVGADPRYHKLEVGQSQRFQGSVKIPDDFRPKELVVEIKPNTARLIPISETFPWNIE